MQNRALITKREPKRGTWAPLDIARDRKLNLNSLDVALLRSLSENPPVENPMRKPVKQIAREIGVDEGTVRSRLKRWESSGFLVYWGATVNHALLGRRRCLLRLEIADQSLKTRALEKLRLIEGVYRIRDYLGGTVSVGIFFDVDAALEKKVRLLQALVPSQTRYRVEIRGLPKPRAGPDETDLLILGVVGWSARKRHLSIARETGLSAKTVRRRMEKMVANHVIGMGPFLDYRRIAGVLVADLLVVCGEDVREKVNERIVALLGDRMMPRTFSSPSALEFRLVLTNVSEQREILGVVSRMEGVESAWLDLLVEDILVAESYYALEKEVLAKAAARRPLRPSTYKFWEESWRVSTDDIYPRAPASPG